MKAKLLSLLFTMALALPLMAQRPVSGKVTSSEDGSALPGVNVVIAGTQQGTITDFEGNYRLDVPANSRLQFSYIGYMAQEIEVGSQSIINVVLRPDVTQLQEVIVTALGVERDVRALNYSVTEVSGEKLTEAREISLGRGLIGRVAGVNVTPPSSGPAGSTRILIRGNKTLNGQNQPLIVVDGIPMDNSNFGQAGLWGGRDQGDGLTSISPDDIESMTVLKGANASALYGARGGNGVINIVTKRGSKRKGVGVEFQTNYVLEDYYDQAELVKDYGSGGYVSGVATKPGSLQQAFGWGRSHWGPKLDGSSVLQWDGVSRPYSYAGDPFKDFLNTGYTFTNSLALSGGGENQSFRFSATDMRNTSILPNSGFDRINVTFSTNARYFDKLTLDAKIMYSNEDVKNRPTLSDSPSNAIQSLWYIPNNVNVNDYVGDPNKPGAIPEGLSDELLLIYGQGGAAKFPGQEWLPASNNWGQNPWWSTFTEIRSDKRDRVVGSARLRYDLTDWLWVSGTAGMDWLTRRNTDYVPEGTGYSLLGSRTEATATIREINLEWMAGSSKNFGKFGYNVFVGGNKMHRQYEYLAANGNAFNVQFFGAINNAKNRNYGYGYDQQGINSLFGSAELSWDGQFFLTATARNDWFSVLNPETNSVFYPSVGASWVFSDTFTGMPSWMSFGKLRASWAQVGLVTIGPYSTALNYELRGETHLGRPLAGYRGALGVGGAIPNPTLKPALSTEIEIGVDLRFLNDRLGLDVTYYNQNTTDDIVNQTIAHSSGFGSTSINVGKITNKGWEFLLNGRPLVGPLTWDISLNFSYNDNEVVELIEGLNEIVAEEPRTRNAFIKHIVGEPFGTITGRVQATDPNGNLVFDQSGRPIANPAFVPIGMGVHPWAGGINNAFTYKGINLEFLIDFKAGGDIFSGTNLRLTGAGRHQQSLLGREGEAPLRVTGVYNSGTSDAPVWTPIDRDLTPQEAIDYWNRLGDQANGVSDFWIYDGSFSKLRQVVLGYSLPRKLLDKTPFQNVNISFVGRNLLVLSKNIENVDPESAYSTNAGAQGLEYFAMPANRSYGFNLRVGF
jgi:TonB-linked SusC/RagA family outer membrane protein